MTGDIRVSANQLIFFFFFLKSLKDNANVFQLLFVVCSFHTELLFSFFFFLRDMPNAFCVTLAIHSLSDNLGFIPYC